MPIDIDHSSISDEDIIGFMSHAGAKPECPCCGGVQWHRLMEPLHGHNYKIPPLLAVASSDWQGLEVIAMYCMSCGFVRQHAAHLIRKWKAENAR